MIRRLSLLNGLGILGVICAHAAQWVYVAMFWWTDRYRPVSVPNYELLGTPSYYGVVLLQKLCVFAVPAFLFVTGFFIAYANRGKSTVSWKMVGTRLKNLLIPYLIWSCVIFVIDALQGDVYPPLEYLRRLVLGDAVASYWYVFLLCQLYLLTPILVPLAKNHPRSLLGISGAMLAVVVFIFYLTFYARYKGLEMPAVDFARSLVPGRSSVRFLFFFVLGLVGGFYVLPLKRWLVRARWILLSITVLSAPLAVAETEWIFRVTGMDWRGGIFTLTGVVYAVSFVLSFLAFEGSMGPFFKPIYQLGRNAYGIYLLHRLILEFLARALQKYLPMTMAFPVLFQLLLTILTAGGPWLLMTAVAKSPARRYYRYLFG